MPKQPGDSGVAERTPDADRLDRVVRVARCTLRVPAVVLARSTPTTTTVLSALGVTGATDGLVGLCRDLATSGATGTVVVDATTATAAPGVSPARADHLHPRAAHVIRLGEDVVSLILLDGPRTFSPDDLTALDDLAHWVEAELTVQDERRATRQLDVLQHRTETVLSGVAEGVVGVDREGRVTFVNAAARHLLGWHGEGLLGADLHAVTHSRTPDGAVFPVEECPVTDVLATGESRRLLHGTFWRYDGTALRTDWSVGAVVEDGDVVGAVVVFGDAAPRLQVEEMKDSFTSVVSHELRTPLTSLKGALDLLDAGVGGSLPQGAERLVGIALRNAHRLARLVDDILDVERSAKGAMPLTRQPIDIGELMAAAAATVQGTAVMRDIHVEVAPFTATVWGDEHRLLQVLTNLLGNALRFSPEGSTVLVHADQDPSAVRVAVTDQGVGIPADALDRVFDRFWQVDSGSRRGSGGSGLGLAIAKNIVEAHGGLILVDSEEGRGSTFTVCLPLRSRSRQVAVDRRRPERPVVASTSEPRLDRVPAPRTRAPQGTGSDAAPSGLEVAP